MKVFALVLYICSGAANSCLQPFIFEDQFDSVYNCMIKGYEESKENNQEELSSTSWDDSTEPLESEPLCEEITFDDFIKPDLRVARIIEANEVPEARKLIQLTLSLGGNETRNVFRDDRRRDALIN